MFRLEVAKRKQRLAAMENRSTKSSTNPSASVPKCLRVATLNVHGWAGNTFVDVCNFLQKEHIDILGLQEAPRARIDSLGQHLFGEETWYKVAWHATALLSRFPLQDVTAPSAGRHCRACINIATNDDERREILVTVVHLDHRKEPRRLQELSRLLYSPMPMPSVWMGDFNSLTRDDYNDAEWHDIANVRALNNWELPQTDVTSVMTGFPRNKLGREFSKYQLCDAYREAPVVSGPRSTCRFNTRIDYVYYGGLDEFELVSCRHLDMMREGLSDHNVVLAAWNIG